MGIQVVFSNRVAALVNEVRVVAENNCAGAGVRNAGNVTAVYPVFFFKARISAGPARVQVHVKPSGGRIGEIIITCRVAGGSNGYYLAAVTTHRHAAARVIPAIVMSA